MVGHAPCSYVYVLMCDANLCACSYVPVVAINTCKYIV